MKVIIDTDPGLDDAVAILYALSEPRFAVQAITSVAGNIGIDRTTDNALRLVAVPGADVPVVQGAAGPLAGTGRSEEAIHGADGLGGVTLPAPLTAPLPGATAFLADRLMREPAPEKARLASGEISCQVRILRNFWAFSPPE